MRTGGARIGNRQVLLEGDARVTLGKVERRAQVGVAERAIGIEGDAPRGHAADDALRGDGRGRPHQRGGDLVGANVGVD